jgi:hypothetical protein
MVPVPTRKVSIRLTVTYAGFEGQSAQLEGLYKRGHEGEQIAPTLYVNHFFTELYPQLAGRVIRAIPNTLRKKSQCLRT